MAAVGTSSTDFLFGDDFDAIFEDLDEDEEFEDYFSCCWRGECINMRLFCGIIMICNCLFMRIQGPVAYLQAKVLLIAFAISVPLLSMHIPAIIL